MISRFQQVAPNLFRGSAPSVKDVINLHHNYNIKNIISLDEESGQKINRICKLLNINHQIYPINFKDKIPLIKLFSNNLKELLTEQPTFVHCFHGKDRTGLLIAIYRCKEEGWSCAKALTEALKLGFGIGLPSDLIKFYTKLVCSSCSKNHIHLSEQDENSADIVDQSRNELMSARMNTSSSPSWAPYDDLTRKFPYDTVYNLTYDQYPTRENYNQEAPDLSVKMDAFPLIGIYDNASGVKGVGPVEPGNGTI